MDPSKRTLGETTDQFNARMRSQKKDVTEGVTSKRQPESEMKPETQEEYSARIRKELEAEAEKAKADKAANDLREANLDRKRAERMDSVENAAKNGVRIAAVG